MSAQVPLNGSKPVVQVQANGDAPAQPANAPAGVGATPSKIESAGSDKKDDSVALASQVREIKNRYLVTGSVKNLKFAQDVDVGSWGHGDSVRVVRDEQTAKDNTFLCINLSKQGVQARVKFTLEGPYGEPDPNDQG